MRVLAPLDGSRVTYEALDRALESLKAMPGVELMLLNVRQEGFENPVDPEYVAQTFEADDEDEVFPSDASSQRALQRGLEIAKRHGIAATTKVRVGVPRKEILDEAAQHDLLVMHAMRRSGLRDLLSGAGTEWLARRVPCSVLLIRSGSKD